MKKTTISFFEAAKWEERYLLDKLKNKKNLKLNFFEKQLSISYLKKIKDTDILAVFIYSKIDKKVLDALPKLKLITTMSTGFDHIDLVECKKRGIKVCNVPVYGENTVAEHTFALILALSRKLPESIERTQEYDFTLDDLCGFDLKGKVLGIVGMGSIGKHVARIGKGFEMKVVVADPNKNVKLAKQLGVKYVGFNYLLAHSDIISLHAPYNKHTHHLINKDNIKLIKKGSYLINTARGGLIETQALMTALNKKILAGAGLDVLEQEYFIKEEKQLLAKPFQEKRDLRTILQGHLLIQDDKVLVTPHNAFNSQEALERILDTTVDNINGFIKGKFINKVK
ncbi:hydroxyacid dehydrogenase [Patescibacteria group bacterium]|nr:hydroxyacid dehydrogenase [Patescibacteria group bacterium]